MNGPGNAFCSYNRSHRSKIQKMILMIWQFPKIRGPQYRPQYTIILIMGKPNKVPLILGNLHLGSLGSLSPSPRCQNKQFSKAACASRKLPPEEAPFGLKALSRRLPWTKDILQVTTCESQNSKKQARDIAGHGHLLPESGPAVKQMPTAATGHG